MIHPTDKTPIVNEAPADKGGSGGAEKKRAPKWLLESEGITQRQWRARKRTDLKNLIKAFRAYRLGCAYCPGVNGEVGSIQTILDSLKNSHATKNWK